MKLTRRHLIQSAALGVTALTVNQPVRAAIGLSVALDWYPNANHAGLFLAEKRGFYESSGLDPDLYTPSDPSTVLQTVGAGRDDFGVSYPTDLLLARAQGVPVVSVAALCQHPLLGVMSLQSSGIARPGDLKWKKVGFPGIPSQQAFLVTMLAKDSLTLNDVDLVNVGFDLVPALISEQVDAVMGAYWTHETILAEREGYPVSMMRVEAWGVPDYYELVVITSEKQLAEEPDLVSRFLEASILGYEEAVKDPNAALDSLEDAYPGLDREVEAAGLDLVIPVWTDGVEVIGSQSAERWVALADWMKVSELIPEDVDPMKAFDVSGLPTR